MNTTRFPRISVRRLLNWASLIRIATVGLVICPTVARASDGKVVTRDGLLHAGDVSLVEGGFAIVTPQNERREITLDEIQRVAIEPSEESLAAAGILGRGWDRFDYGPGTSEGVSGQGKGVFVLKVQGDGGHLVYRRASLTGEMVTRVDGLSAGSRAGLQARRSARADSSVGSVFLTDDGSVHFSVTSLADNKSTTFATGAGTAMIPCWLKLTRSEKGLEAFYSQDGDRWTRVGKPSSQHWWKRVASAEEEEEEKEEEEEAEEDDSHVWQPILAGLFVESVGKSADAVFSEVRLRGLGLKGEYFEGSDFQQHVLTRSGDTVGPAWREGSPIPELKGKDEFSIRWTGELIPRETGSHKFLVGADYAAALWIDGTIVAGDRWPEVNQAEASLDLEAGKIYKVRVDYSYASEGGARDSHHLYVNMTRPAHREDDWIPAEMLRHEVRGEDVAGVAKVVPGVVLNDGSFLVGRLLRADANQMVLTTAKMEQRSVSRDDVHRIILTSQLLEEAAADGQRLGARMTSGDFLEGSLRDAKDGSLRMESLVFGLRSFPLSEGSVAEVILCSRVAGTETSNFEIRDIEGSRWLLPESPLLSPQRIVFRHPLIGEQRIPADSFVGMVRLQQHQPEVAPDAQERTVPDARAQNVPDARQAADAEDISFPPCEAVVDVTQPPYSAKGDGKSDDTDAIQKALKDAMGQHKIIYIPNGTYLVSKTIRWSKQNSQGNDAWGFNYIQGQNADKTILRLKDGTFTSADDPKSIMWCGGFGSADWFHNYIQNVTFDVGNGNPGAIGLQFYSNNTGALRSVRIVSQDGKGTVGLDLASDMNGPLLARNILVKGFAVGIRCGHSVNSQTFERISLLGQSQCALRNEGQSISVRSLHTEGTAPAVQSNGGRMALLDANLVGEGGAENVPAITANGGFYARDVVTRGYREAIVCQGDNPGAAGPNVAEFMSHRPTSPFPSPARSLGLPVKETPELPWDDPQTWAVVDAFGAQPDGEGDSSTAIQKAIDSGATTVFFPGSYVLKSTVTVRGNVRRLIGTGNWINYGSDANPEFRVVDGNSPIVAFEHFQSIGDDHPGIEVATNRTVVLRSTGTRVDFKGKGDVFLEDFGTHDMKLNPGLNVWARQLNVENEGTHVTNNGAALWILGYKTERGGTLIDTRGGGSTELLGTFSYTTTAGGLAPMFVNTDSSVFAFFHEVCYSGDPFQTLIRETRGGTTKEVAADQGGIAPYIGYVGQ